MATLATSPFEQRINPLEVLGLLGKQISSSELAKLATHPLITALLELVATLVWVPVGVLAMLLGVILWPVLFIALPLILMVATPFVVGYKLVAALKRERRAAG